MVEDGGGWWRRKKSFFFLRFWTFIDLSEQKKLVEDIGRCWKMVEDGGG